MGLVLIGRQAQGCGHCFQFTSALHKHAESCLKERLSGYRGNIDQGKGRKAGPAVSPGNSEVLSPITFQLTPVLGQAGKNVD